VAVRDAATAPLGGEASWDPPPLSPHLTPAISRCLGFRKLSRALELLCPTTNRALQIPAKSRHNALPPTGSGRWPPSPSSSRERIGQRLAPLQRINAGSAALTQARWFPEGPEVAAPSPTRWRRFLEYNNSGSAAS
jgi:hypothetical protein